MRESFGWLGLEKPAASRIVKLIRGVSPSKAKDIQQQLLRAMRSDAGRRIDSRLMGSSRAGRKALTEIGSGGHVLRSADLAGDLTNWQRQYAAIGAERPTWLKRVVAGIFGKSTPDVLNFRGTDPVVAARLFGTSVRDCKKINTASSYFVGTRFRDFFAPTTGRKNAVAPFLLV